jgi:hypothetical protein
MGGVLVPKITTSTLVFRIGGVWHNQLTARMDDPVVANVDVWVDPSNAANTLRLFFSKPTVVPGDLYAGLSALTPADPSWSPGTLTLL